MSSISKEQKEYLELPGSEGLGYDVDASPERQHQPQSLWMPTFVLLITLSALSLTVGVFIGRNTISTTDTLSPSFYTYPAPSGSQFQKWSYNRTFTLPPSKEVDRAWESLFPEGSVGFIQHPKLSPAPMVSGVSVFHQLHCLNSLRIGYYSALMSEPETPPEHNDHSEHDDPHHVRHCIDYLRQSLICAADANLEPVDTGLGGSTGWGSTRTCRDFGDVTRFANEWKAGIGIA